MQDDDLISALTTVLVIPLTTNLKRLSLPTTVLISKGNAGLDHDSVALCHHLQVRGKAGLISRIGALSPDCLAEVQECLLDVLGL